MQINKSVKKQNPICPTLLTYPSIIIHISTSTVPKSEIGGEEPSVKILEINVQISVNYRTK